MTRVSMIIAVYNCEAYIGKCIDSIINQTFSDWELIIYDDASTDHTWEIIQEYKAKDIRIVAEKNERNMKAGATRNRCIRISHGKYIAIQDADDYSAPDRIEKQVKFLDENPKYDFVGSGVYSFDEDGAWGVCYKQEPKKSDFLYTLPFAHPSTMFRRSALEKINGYLETKETRRGQDYDMFMRMYAQGMVGYNLPDILYYYREDKVELSRRKYIYRIDEARIRYRGFKKLGLMPGAWIYVIKPLIVGLIPASILRKYKKRQMKDGIMHV